MAPKRKASAATAKGTSVKKRKEVEAPEVHEKPSSKKAKTAQPTLPAQTRSRTGKQPPIKNANKNLKKPKHEEKTPTKKTSEEALNGAKLVTASNNTNCKNIIIEHCKQCSCFKIRALKVKEELERQVKGVRVTLNTEKPRKGCFEVRNENGFIFISLLNMPRPFKKLKELDMEETINEIVAKLKRL